MADALASGASVLRDVGVQVPLRPPQDEATNSQELVASFFVVGYLAAAWMKLRTKSKAVPANGSPTG